MVIMEELKRMRENIVKRLEETNSKLEGYRDIEEKVGGENKEKSKEPSKITAD